MSIRRPVIVGIVNITEDSFSDGGAYLDPRRAVEHACTLIEDGADIVELGPASSHPDSRQVIAAEERRRLQPVLDELLARGQQVGVDSCLGPTQAYCLERGVALLNDITGFPDEASYPALAAATCKLVVMHSLQRAGKATREPGKTSGVLERITRFFDERCAVLRNAGIDDGRLILDPGMGFFLGDNPEPSLHTLANIKRLRERYGLAVMVSVSRKSFLGAVTGRAVEERGAATLAAELHAASQGVDYIRTHDVRALVDGLAIIDAIGRNA